MAEEIKFDETVSYLLARVNVAFRNALERHMGTVGLHGGQIFVLLELWKEDGLRQVDLASRLNLAAPTVNKMLKGLIEIGLVTRSRADADARSTRIFLTDRGVEMRAEVEAQWVELEEYCLSGLSETERLILFDVLRKLLAAFTGRVLDDDDD